MQDFDTLLLAVAVALNGVLAWSAARMAWNTTRIANGIDEKTNQRLQHAELSQESLIEILKALKKG